MVNINTNKDGNSAILLDEGGSSKMRKSKSGHNILPQVMISNSVPRIHGVLDSKFLRPATHRKHVSGTLEPINLM